MRRNLKIVEEKALGTRLPWIILNSTKLERKVEEGRRKFLAFVYPLLVKLLRVKG